MADDVAVMDVSRLILGPRKRGDRSWKTIRAELGLVICVGAWGGMWLRDTQQVYASRNVGYRRLWDRKEFSYLFCFSNSVGENVRATLRRYGAVEVASSEIAGGFQEAWEIVPPRTAGDSREFFHSLDRQVESGMAGAVSVSTGSSAPSKRPGGDRVR